MYDSRVDDSKSKQKLTENLNFTIKAFYWNFTWKNDNF